MRLLKKIDLMWVLVIILILILFPILLNFLIHLRMGAKDGNPTTFLKNSWFECSASSTANEIWGKCLNKDLNASFEYPIGWNINKIDSSDLLFTYPGTKEKFLIKVVVYEKQNNELAKKDALGQPVQKRIETKINELYATLPDEDSDFSFPYIKIVEDKHVFLFTLNDLEEVYNKLSITQAQTRDIFNHMYKSFSVTD